MPFFFFFLNWQVHNGQLLPCGKLLETTAPLDFPDENLRARMGKWVVVNPLDWTYLKIATWGLHLEKFRIEYSTAQASLLSPFSPSLPFPSPPFVSLLLFPFSVLLSLFNYSLDKKESFLMYFLNVCVCACALSHSLYPSLCGPIDCSPPGSPVHGLSQARILEWVAIFFFRKSSWPRNQTWVSCVSCLGRRILNC